MIVAVHRGNDRFLTRLDWLTSWHSFSFADHYDPANTSFGLLVAHNDETLSGGAGFEPHRHAATDLITWVIEGRLLHEDSLGHRCLVQPGHVQRLAAGRGVVHSEQNASSVEPVRYVQAWVHAPVARDPAYDVIDVSDRLGDGGLVAVADSPNEPDASFLVARLSAGTCEQLPAAAFLHVYVARGDISLVSGDRLGPGDALRVHDAPPPPVTAGEGGAELLVWAMSRRIAAPTR